MISFFANIFGYLLNILYMFIKNYGIAIILFSIVVKILLLPLSIKQQKSMKKSAEMQDEMQSIRKKYKNDPDKMNQATIELYKREKMSPFSGCFGAIAQLILLLSVFYLVRSPLTYMKKIDSNTIEQYKSSITDQTAYPEIQIINEKGKENEEVYINMNFFGIDLSKVPTQSLNNPKVYIIPVLYVLSSVISIRYTNNMQKKKKDEIIDVTEESKNTEKGKNEEELDAMEQANKTMTWFMPIMAVSIAVVAPLGLALYWLINNILMITERAILNKFLESKEEKADAR